MSGSKNNISRVKGVENLFQEYINDAEKEVNEWRIPKASKQDSIENLVQICLKQLTKKSETNTSRIKVNKVPSVMDIRNDRKKQEYKMTSPLTRLLDIIEYSTDLVVNKLVDVFKSHHISNDIFPNKQTQKEKMKLNDEICLKMIKNKRKKNHFVDCNRLRKFSSLHKRSAKNVISNNTSMIILKEFQDVKEAMNLGRMNDNDWDKQRYFFHSRRKSKTILDDSSRSYMNNINLINRLANMRQSGISWITFYKNENNNDKINSSVVDLVKSSRKEKCSLTFELDECHLNNKSKLIRYKCQGYEQYATNISSVPEYLVYTAENNIDLTVNSNRKIENNRKPKPMKKLKNTKKMVKLKPKPNLEQNPRKKAIDFCFVCKKIRTCLCSTKPEVISESPSAQVQREVDSLLDPDEAYAEDEYNFQKQTYVYTAISEPCYNIRNPNSDNSKNPVVCSIDVTGPDSGNIVIKDAKKLYNLGFKINDWYLKPVR